MQGWHSFTFIPSAGITLIRFILPCVWHKTVLGIISASLNFKKAPLKTGQMYKNFRISLNFFSGEADLIDFSLPK
ncbi:MAG: hypothetical protein K0S33_2018 [Bacteroidetes bacterium]|nr:hypothetical protein [Bacteroidota bacterium]